MFEVRAFIDRREGGRAVLLVGSGNIPVDWPSDLLPPDAEPGKYLVVQMKLDETETSARKARVEDLIRKLSERPEQ